MDHISGVYRRLETNPSAGKEWLNILPGLAHIALSPQKTKGAVMLAGALLCIQVLVALLILPAFGEGILKSLPTGLEFLNSTPFSFALRVGLSACFGLLLFYLYAESAKDLASHFNEGYLDRKTTLFAPALSGASLFHCALFLALLFLGVFRLAPIEIENVLEMEPVDVIMNPPNTKVQNPPENTKRISDQNAQNSGKAAKELPLNTQNASKNGNNQAERKTIYSKPAQESQANSQNNSPYQQKPSKQSQAAPPQPKALARKQPMLPLFKPQNDDERSVLDNGQVGASASAQSAKSISSLSGGGGGGASSRKGVAPVLGGREGSNTTGRGTANSELNSNPNGPVTVAARKSVDYGPFMRDLQRRIQGAWKPGTKNGEVSIRFKLNKNGSLIPGSVAIIRGGEPEAEAAARKAIMDAAPGFRPLPEGSADLVAIEFTFTLAGVRYQGSQRY